MYTIRRLRPTDYSKVYRLFCASIQSQFPEYTPGVKAYIVKERSYWNRVYYKNKLHNKNRIMFGAFKKTVLVGILDAEHPFGGVSMGSWLIVNPQFKRKGIGTRLLRRWQKEISKRGGHMLYLYSPRRNVTFYKKIGFTKAGFLSKGYFGIDEYIFTKQIRKPNEHKFLTS